MIQSAGRVGRVAQVGACRGVPRALKRQGPRPVLVTRPDGFDLAAYWTAYQRDFHARPHRVEALVRLAPGVTLPRAVPVGRSPGEDGWTTARVAVESVEHAHGEFLRLGTDIEVLEPAELRRSIARTVAELAELAEKYGNVAGNGGD